MNKEIYINGMGIVSPIGDLSNLNPPIEAEDRYNVVEPNYADYFPARAARRMCKVLKISQVAANLALRNANLEQTDGVIVGTAIGNIKDSEKFLSDLIKYKEQLLAPTSFIQSTHNTIAGQIGMSMNCYGYNSTYSHKIFSFEWTVLDAMLQIQDGLGENYLVGAADETTDLVFEVLSHFKQHGKEKFPAGEGAGFYVLSANKVEQSLAKLELCKIHHKYDGLTDLREELNKVFPKGLADFDCILTGASAEQDEFYKPLAELPTFPFKSLSGNYQTASSFALGLAVKLLNGERPLENDRFKPQIDKVLICNHFGQNNLAILSLSNV